MKVTVTAAARACGISKQAFQKAEVTGRLRSCGNNEKGQKLYDVEDCRRMIAENTDPTKSVNSRAQQRRTEPNTPADFFEPPDNSKAGVQLARDKVKLRHEELKLAVLEGKLVDGDKVRSEQQARAAAEREALLNLPGRASAELAGKFQVNEREMFGALKAIIRRHLTERSTTPVNA